MKYNLINKSVNRGTICEKVVVEGFDYYYNTEIIIFKGDYMYNSLFNKIVVADNDTLVNCKGIDGSFCAKIVATNNPKIEIPQVIDEEKEIAYNYYLSNQHYLVSDSRHFANGYNKSQETHCFTKEDMINFVRLTLEDAKKSVCWSDEYYKILAEELIQKRTKTIYYE